MDTALKIDRVFQTFRNGFFMKSQPVLNDVSFGVPRQSVFGLLGANGAGKTTLIQLLTGLRKPTQGRVFIEGADAYLPAARRCIGYLPERPYFYQHLTGKKLLRLMGTLSGLESGSGKDALESRMRSVLELVKMEHAADKELRHYSKGMLQRIGVAQAILHDPEILILDEPMSGLDPAGRREIRELIQTLSKQGKTVFFTTHLLEDVELLCDQIAILKKGKLVQEGLLRDLFDAEGVEVEIVFQGEPVIASELCLGLSFETLPVGKRVCLQGRVKIQEFISGVFASGGSVLSVTPLKRPMEKYIYGDLPPQELL
jgi:ABC-2 type transport system ATP-binding protein